jgi:hypothetical protein
MTDLRRGPTTACGTRIGPSTKPARARNGRSPGLRRAVRAAQRTQRRRRASTRHDERHGRASTRRRDRSLGVRVDRDIQRHAAPLVRYLSLCSRTRWSGRSLRGPRHGGFVSGDVERTSRCSSSTSSITPGDASSSIMSDSSALGRARSNSSNLRWVAACSLPCVC